MILVTLPQLMAIMTVKFFVWLGKVLLWCLSVLLDAFRNLVQKPYSLCVIWAVLIPLGGWFPGEDSWLYERIPWDPLISAILCILVLLAIVLGIRLVKYANAALCTLCWSPIFDFLYIAIARFFVNTWIFILMTVLGALGLIGFYVYSLRHCRGKKELPFLISPGIAGVFNALTAVVFAISVKGAVWWGNGGIYSEESGILESVLYESCNAPADRLSVRIILAVIAAVVLVATILARKLLNRLA